MTMPLITIQTDNVILSVAYSKDGAKIVSGSTDKSVRVWDASTGAALQQLNGHTANVNSVAFSHDGMYIVSGSSDKSVRVWDFETGVELRQLNGHTHWSCLLHFHMMAFTLSLAHLISLCGCGMPHQVQHCNN